MGNAAVVLKKQYQDNYTEMHNINGFADYRPIKEVNYKDYKDYTVFMSHFAHEIKRLGKDDFIAKYRKSKATGIKARYLKALLSYLSKDNISRPYKSSNLVLDPLTYELYFTYGREEILESRIKKAIPEFVMQGLLVTDIQEAVGGTFS